MKTILVSAVVLVLGFWAGAEYMRYSVGQLFATGEGRSLCLSIIGG